MGRGWGWAKIRGKRSRQRNEMEGMTIVMEGKGLFPRDAL